MREIGYAKINLGLKVLGKRADGYHAVDMVMQTISFADYVDFAPAPKFVLTMDDPDLPCDQRNLAYKAAAIISEATGNPLNVKISINKQIFIAIDKLNSYDQETAITLKKLAVLELSKDKLLFGVDWKTVG